ncbi:MAG TPA: NADP(H)-dependent aldo-keto reductase [Kiloniellales bacterium]|nr:NADP(H)-dependent aldo-keto reductase [Kiloniellales bacterium]
MEYRALGRSGLKVSAVCLGTMTWGEQNSEAEGHQQMDLALDRGVTFWDTAEMYPVAPRRETYGRTEEVIGTWFASRKQRDKVILATKAVGPGDRFKHIRDGAPKHNRKHLLEAVDASLKRLRTDYIDLYQLHWPERPVNSFGTLGYAHDPKAETTPLEETLDALAELVQSGKVRHVGVSNETPWGLMRYLQMADAGRGPRMVSIQNAYSLLNRTFEQSLAEIAHREEVGLLAYAPAAAGVLSGKYLNGARPPGARITLFPQNTRYFTASGQEATAAYVALAKQHGVDPVRMATAFVLSRPFVTAAIVGATSLPQLENQLAAMETRLAPEVLAGIETIHARHTYPCP